VWRAEAFIKMKLKRLKKFKGKLTLNECKQKCQEFSAKPLQFNDLPVTLPMRTCDMISWTTKNPSGTKAKCKIFTKIFEKSELQSDSSPNFYELN